MSKIWSKDETLWSFALYGTAVGAGTLFLPIQLGSAGAIVLFITALVAYPLTYWPHARWRNLFSLQKQKAMKGSPAPSRTITARRLAI
jgi:serine transporter